MTETFPIVPGQVRMLWVVLPLALVVSPAPVHAAEPTESRPVETVRLIANAKAVGEDAAGVMRQPMAGMLWSQQFYFFDGDSWLEEHNSHPLHSGYHSARNSEWFHMVNEDVISMPDTPSMAACPVSGCFRSRNTGIPRRSQEREISAAYASRSETTTAMSR